MPRWTIDKPERLTFGAVTDLTVRIAGGHLAVLASDGPPTLEVTEVGEPLLVEHDEDGRLTVEYQDQSLLGLLGGLKAGNRRCVLTLTVPKECAVRAGTVSAGAVLAGFEGRTRVRSVSGTIVLDGVSGDIAADTVAGMVESRALAGDLTFNSVSGELTVAGGVPHRLRAKTVTGRITADLELNPTGDVVLTSVSGPVFVRLPGSVQTDVSLRSTSGTLDSEFPGLVNGSAPGQRTLSGRLGGGMASLRATTVSGEITLLRKETTA